MAEPQTLPFHSSAPKPDATIMRTRGRIDEWRGEGGAHLQLSLHVCPEQCPRDHLPVWEDVCQWEGEKAITHCADERMNAYLVSAVEQSIVGTVQWLHLTARGPHLSTSS